MLSHGPAVAAYVALTVAFYWPAVAHISSRALSDGLDGASFLWGDWAIPRAVLHLHNPFLTHQIFFPVGVDTALHTNTALWAMVSWPLARLFGLGQAATILGLFAVAASGVAAYALATHVTGERWAGFVAGTAFTILPYRYGRAVAHHNLNHTELLPLGLLAMVLLYEAPTRRRALALGGVFGATLLTDITYSLFLLIAAVVLAAVRWRQTWTRLLGLRWAQAGAVAALIASPLLLAILAALGRQELDPLPAWGGADSSSSDLLSWVIPPVTHPWWGSSLRHVATTVSQGERVSYVGMVMLLLAVAGMLVGRRRAPWGALAGVFGVLALGPFLHVDGTTGSGFSYLGSKFAVPLPYLAIHFVPVLNGLRNPARFSVVAALALDVLAAMAIARLLRRSRRLGVLAAAAAVAATVIEFLPGSLIPLQPVAVPRAYDAITASHPGAVLEIPMQWRDGFLRVGDSPAGRDDTIFLYYATRHGRPVVSGMVARLPHSRLVALERHPVLRQILALQGEPGFAGPVSLDATQLRRAGIGYVVYHRDRPVPPVLSWLNTSRLPVAADDGTVVVFAVP